METVGEAKRKTGKQRERERTKSHRNGKTVKEIRETRG